MDTCRLKKTLLVCVPMDCAARAPPLALLRLLPSPAASARRVAALTASVACKA